MKHILLLLILSLSGNVVFSQSEADKRLWALINDQEIFKLKREFDKTAEADLSEFILLLSKSIINSCFNQPEEAVKDLKVLLSYYADVLGADGSIAMANLLVENYESMRQYDKAAESLGDLIAQTDLHIDENSLIRMRNGFRIFEALSKVPGQKTTYTNQHIAIFRDRMGIMNVPVKGTDGEAYPFCLDTGAEYSVIPERLVEKLAVDILADSVILSGFADVIGKIGVSKRMQVGSVLAEHVIFFIVPDSSLMFTSTTKFADGKPMQYELEGIMGWDFIRDMKKIKISQSELIPLTEEEPIVERGNFIVSSMTPYVEVISGKDTLIFNLDTGASLGGLTYDYYKKHQHELTTNVQDTIVEMAGLGGDVRERILVLKNFPLTIGGASCIVPSLEASSSNAKALTDNISLPVDGTIGQDIIELYNHMIIDMENKSVVFMH